MILPPNSPKSIAAASDSANVVAGLRAIVGSGPTRVFEIRVLGYEETDWRGERTIILNGLYHGREIEIAARDILSLKGRYRGVYVGLNEPRNRRFGWSRSANRLRETLRTVSDADIGQRDGVMIDIDPVRAEGHKNDPATDVERAAAWRVTKAAVADLSSRDWPTPTIISTGNGYQITYQTEALPANTDLVHRTLVALAAKHGTPEVHVDTTVGNASRIVRVAGTPNNKGTASPDRPHRMAELVQAGAGRLVTVAMVEAEAASVPAVPSREIIPTIRRSTCTELSANLDRRIADYLDRCPVAVEGSGGRTQTFRVAAAMVSGFALSEDDAIRALTDWNSRCIPPWPEGQLRERVRAAIAGGRVGYRSLIDTDRASQHTGPHPADLIIPDLLAAPHISAPIDNALTDAIANIPTGTPPSRVHRRGILNSIGDELSGPRCADSADSMVCGKGCLVICGCPEKFRVRDTGIKDKDTGNSDTELLDRLIGTNSNQLCPTPPYKFAEGIAPDTDGCDIIIVTPCEHWSCSVCRENRRYEEKAKNVPLALAHGTHTFIGTSHEWDAVRKRLERVKVDGEPARICKGVYPVWQGGECYAYVIAVAKSDLHLVPENSGLNPVSGPEAATFCAEAIDRMPDYEILPIGRKKVKRFNPNQVWKELAVPATGTPFATIKKPAPKWSFIPGILAHDYRGVLGVLRDHRQAYAEDTLVPQNGSGSIIRSVVWRAEPATRYAIRRELLHLPAEPGSEMKFALGISNLSTPPTRLDDDPDENAIHRLMADWGSRA